MKTFTASTLLVLAAQLLSTSANPVPAAGPANLVARACDCTAYRNAEAIGDKTAAANAISSCSTPCPASAPNAPATAPAHDGSPAQSSDGSGSDTQKWGDYTPTLWYDSPLCYPCEGKQYYQAGCHCEDCGHLPRPCEAAP